MKNSLWKFTETEKFNLAVIFIFASLVMLPVLIYGVPNGYDMPHHYQTAMTYRDEILAGNFYPSWTNLRNLGYGGMELRLYPPVSHYVLALFSLAVKDWHLATWLSFTFWWVLGSFGVYFWGRELGAPRYALVAALIYAVMPHRLNQAYIVFFYGEFAGSAILPFCFAFAARIARETKSSDDESFSFRKNGLINLNVIGLAISFALLILTHLPLTLIAAFTLVIYCAANAKPNLKYCVGYFSRLATGGILALLATSFFWTKVLQERSILAKATVYEDIFLDYKLNFLLSPFQSYFSSTMPVYEEITLYYNIVLLITLFSIVPVSLLFFSYGNALKNRKSRSVWIVFLSAVFLTTPLSKLIWDNFSLLQEVQFPWRWLSIISLFAAPLTAAGLSVLQTWFTDKRRPFALIFAGTILIGSFFSLSNAIRGAAYTKPKDVASYMEDLNREAGFKFWWTIWTRAEFIQDCDEKVSAGNRGVIIDKWENTERIFTVDDGESIRQIRIATFYHPNWTATVNDVPVEITPDKNGALQIPISTDSSVVKISFQETSIVASARWISGIVWLFLFFWIFRQTRNSFLLTNNNSDPKNAENKIIYNFAYKLFA
ncbi:MAG TPA: hypothetical protein VF692_13825, partial [Pyrinomonadaceae bacterium]